MPPSKKGDNGTSVDIMTLTTKSLQAHIVGTSPLICNAMSQKVQQDLLLPAKKKNRAEKEGTLKHDPLAEYQRSPYRSKGDDAATRIIFPGGGFKAALAQAALDIPGAKKAEIGRLSYVTERNIPIYGIPQMYMAVVRSADMARTPDVRTRAILDEWAATVTVTFVTPNLTEQAVANLLAAAGIIVGIGDGRPQKGKLNFGQFRLASEGDPQFRRIVGTGGREAQDDALANPTCYDLETEELWSWWQAEARRRGFEVA